MRTIAHTAVARRRRAMSMVAWSIMGRRIRPRALEVKIAPPLRSNPNP
jgi:hypothetical protein